MSLLNDVIAAPKKRIRLDWFDALSPNNQKQVREVMQKRALGEIDKSVFQIAEIIAENFGLTERPGSIRHRLVEIEKEYAKCQKR